MRKWKEEGLVFWRDREGFSHLQIERRSCITKRGEECHEKSYHEFLDKHTQLSQFHQCDLHRGLASPLLPELNGSTVLGLTRYDWGSVHWILALSFFIIIIVHLVLHWNWAKGSFKKYLRMGPKALVTVTVITIFFGLLVPAYLTKDFPSRKDFKDTYSSTSSLEVENKEGVTAMTEKGGNGATQ